MVQVFEGITVLDFTHGMAGSIATLVMSDFGADVIKVEPPGGEPFRAWPASVQWNRGKRSAVLDLKTSEGRERAQRLAQQADVVLVAFRPGVPERLGIDYETLAAENPSLVYCSLSGYGPNGPYSGYKGYEGAVAAKTGRFMAFAGQAGRDGPHYTAVQTGSHAAAMALVRGTIAALYVRNRTGEGQKVETSILQALTPYDLRDWIVWQMMLKDPENFQEDPWAGLRRRPTPGYLPGRTRDGRWIQMANIVDRPFKASMHALGLGWIFDDPRFEGAPMLMPEEQETLRGLIQEQLQQRTLDEWMHTFLHDATDVAAEPFMSAQEGMHHPQIVHNGHIQDVRDPRVGRTRQLGPLAYLRDTPGSVKGPAPGPGQHTEEVLSTSREPAARGASNGSGAMPAHPLGGITVLDLATVIAGPLACSLLAELGARVIRIEPPEGDFMRRNQSGIAANRTMGGAEGVCLDLKVPEAREVLLQLIKRAGIIVHNMRPGAPERLGIGYEQVAEMNPNLVYVYAGGYGSTGPSSHRPSMHPIPGAVCGGASTQMGRGAVPGPDEPMTPEEIREVSRRFGRANEANPDPNSSMAISVAALLGLYARERTGRGQYVEATMLCANAYANADDFFWYDGRPERALPDSEGYGLHALYRLYETQDGWIFLACPFEHEWQALCRSIEREDLLGDPRFTTREARLAHDDALIRELEQVFATHPARHWESLLTGADVACVQAEDRGPYHFFAEDPHVAANGFTTEVEHARFGSFWRHSPLITFSKTPGRAGPGPLKGQHTRAVLRELGYTEAGIAALQEKAAAYWEEE